MKEKIIAYFSTLIPILIIDGIWLAVVAKNFYTKYIGSLMAKSPNLLAAGLFYLLYALGLLVLIVLPAVKGETSFLKIFLFGALFGLVAYATYDLTNLATIKDWPLMVTLVDILWGTTYTGVVSLIAVYLTRLFV
jgi:uncharacterized membrane protein